MESVSRLAKAILREFDSSPKTINSLTRCISNAMTRTEQLGDNDVMLKEIATKAGNKKTTMNEVLLVASSISRSRLSNEIESTDIVCAAAKIAKYTSNHLYSYILSESGTRVASKVEMPGNMCLDSLEEPIVGRLHEITQLAACIARKNRVPFVIGKTGVGKTSVVKGLARLLAFNAIPQLNGMVLLDTSKYLQPPVELAQGQMQMIQPNIPTNTIQGLQLPGSAEQSRAIGVFDGAGKQHAQQINTMRKHNRVLVTCDESEYSAIVDTSKELKKSAVVIRVSEPSDEETKKIMHIKAKKFEYDFNCKIADDVLDYAVDVSTKFHSEASQPTKTLTLMEITCATKRVKITKDSSFLETDIEKEIRDGNIPLLKKLIEASGNESLAKAMLVADTADINREEVSDTLRIVADISPNVPLAAITADSVKLLQMLEPYVKEKVYGQDDAISSICKAIKRKSLGLSDPQRPASFLFVGPTGVGKTWLATQIAELMFGSDKSLVRFDMSEYMERHSVSKLIGAPPGYIGFDKGGQLTNKVYNRPHCVLLLDEIEKAHPDILNALLQVLEDGRLTDSRDREVTFRHCIIIMTSNLGTKRSIKYGMGFGKSKDESSKEKVSDEIKGFMSPEFINRLNMIVYFKSLSDKPLKRILQYQLNHLGEFSSYKISIKDGVIDHMMKRVKDNEKVELYGAREVKRIIETEVTDQIANEIIKEGLPTGTTVFLKIENDKLVAKKEK